MKRPVLMPRRREKLALDPQWYKDAIIYEVRIRSFLDSNGDGIGDIAGLTSKLDYLQDLGVTALWLLPFYPSPMRDDGYDIAEYTDVHPEVGTLADFELFLAEAHRRGLRVITELVMNHTSDQHSWFKRARRASPGSSDRNFYVWSDTPERYREARIIFKDFEPSNWSWDPVAKAYFWHRFYAHQPDLNFENPDVHEALFQVVDFWFDKGVDGLRLDAVPYLYEADGTNCENLPATHEFIKKLRAHVDSKFQGKMLLAEANQWPEDAAAYYGDGDECHMNFHFPIMPRIFMSIHMEDRFPILDILAQTPQLPEGCQWALFLRNHDELTLEMVTDEERDYMYRAYAHDATMRINLGIRRRLAPLVGNDRRKMELLNGLLFSLPGTPVLYYGDEIGMGDNVYLGDRNGVRTPMQWSADRNAGFSRANPQRMILPINIDPEYHFESLNVEAQQNNPNSLLWWTKRLIALRRRFQAFGRGSIEFLKPANYRVLAFVRQYNDEMVLVVANLSRFVQYVELDMSQWRGMRPVELFGSTEFPSIGELPYLLTLPGHTFYLFSLERPGAAEAAEAALPAAPIVECATADALLQGEDRGALEDLLPAFVEGRRWFEGRNRISGLKVLEAVRLLDALSLLLLEVELASGDTQRYVLPAAVVNPQGRGPVAPGSIIAQLKTKAGEELLLVDALEETSTARLFLQAMLERRRVAGTEGHMQATMFEHAHFEASEADVRIIAAQHESAAAQYGETYLLKVMRRFEDGVSPELELSRYLDGKAPGLTPVIAGAFEYRRRRAEPATLAVLERFVRNEGTAWDQARAELGRYYERVLTSYRSDPPPPLPSQTAATLATTETPDLVRQIIGPYLESAALLGRRTAEMHIALAANTDDPEFAPQPYSTLDRRSKYQTMRNVVGTSLRLLRSRLDRVPPRWGDLARKLVVSEDKILKFFEPLLTPRVSGLRIRTHGDYHLNQVLFTGKDYVIIDFDGGRGRSLEERRRRRSPLRDVASMLRSFDYAALWALMDERIVREADRDAALPWAHHWHSWTSAAFLQAYLVATRAHTFMPPSTEGMGLLLDTLLIQRAFEELHGDLDRSTETVGIPLYALVRLLRLNGD